jgi:Tfp pilus assembly protein PilO
MSFFGRENFDQFRESFLDKGAVSRVFEGFRQKLTALQAASDTLLSQHPNDPDITILANRAKLEVNHLSLTWELIEATMLNLINVYEMTNKIIETNTQEEQQRKAEFENMKKELDAHKQKLADIIKHEPKLEWLDKWFKSESNRADK